MQSFFFFFFFFFVCVCLGIYLLQFLLFCFTILNFEINHGRPPDNNALRVASC
jgi:hypothetical protein